jgi:hypothetical protein
MRSKLLKLLLGCGLLAAAISPGFACNYNVNASNDQAAPQHTAQAQSSTDSHSN